MKKLSIVFVITVINLTIAISAFAGNTTEHYLLEKEGMSFIAVSHDTHYTSATFTGVMVRRGWFATPLPLGADGNQLLIVTLECDDPATETGRVQMSGMWFGTEDSLLEFQKEINVAFQATLKKLKK
jgi:hypothetical protein